MIADGLKEAYRRNGRGEIDALGDGHRSVLKGAGKVDIVKLLAQVCSCGEKLNEAVLDSHLDVSTRCDGLLDDTRGRDEECLATMGNH